MRTKIYNTYTDKGDYFEMEIEYHNKSKKCSVKIDKNDLEKVKTGKWSYSPSVGYSLRIIDNKTTLLHQVIMGRKKGYFIDHINGDRFDNRKLNLRYVNPQESACNRSNMRGVYLSSYYKNKKDKKWVSHIIYKKKFHYLGIFNTEEEALKVRREAEKKYFGDFRRVINVQSC